MAWRLFSSKADGPLRVSRITCVRALQQLGIVFAPFGQRAHCFECPVWDDHGRPQRGTQRRTQRPEPVVASPVVVMTSGQFRPVGEGMDILRPLSRDCRIFPTATRRKRLVSRLGLAKVLLADGLGLRCRRRVFCPEIVRIRRSAWFPLLGKKVALPMPLFQRSGAQERRVAGLGGQLCGHLTDIAGRERKAWRSCVGAAAVSR
jgi:hypothetical protein